MHAFAVGLLVVLPMAFDAPAASAGPAGGQWRQRGEALRDDLRTMNGSAVGGRLSAREVVLESERLRAGFNRLDADTGDRSEADDALNRELANQSFTWLRRAGLRFQADATVAQALMQTYGLIGDFYRSRFPYPGGAWFAYVDAARWARMLALNGPRGGPFERDLERFAVSWATVAYASGFAGWPSAGWRDVQGSTDLRPPTRPGAITQVALPAVDERSLSADQRVIWVDLQPRFRQVTAGVYQARLLLDELARRLGQQRPGATLNVQDAATALNMQGFLDDAADLVRDGKFERAAEALNRADYLRARLKNVTGQ